MARRNKEPARVENAPELEREVREISHLDTLVHQPKRLSILAALEPEPGGEYNLPMLRRVTGITDGNLNPHLLKLEEAGLVKTQKRLVGGRSETVVSLTEEGRDAISGYLSQTEGILSRWKKRRTKQRFE